jgi:hypothetical protein
MGIKAMNAPLQSRSRRAKYPYTEAEVKEAAKLLNEGKTPGVGPYEGENALREARSAAQSLIRHVQATNPELDNLGSRAWEDENGDAFAIVRVRD